MKMAKLPNGKTLQFPDGTPDEAIDATVQHHMKDHIAKSQKTKERDDILVQHQEQIIQLMLGLMQTMQSQEQLLKQIVENNNNGHATLMGALGNVHKAASRLKKTKVIRDDKQKIIGGEEEYVE